MGQKNSYQGLQENIRDMKLPVIDVWKNQYSDKIFTVNFQTDEFTCICPKTGLPDFASIVIEYIPGIDCLELKSFKEYLLSYRGLGIFHEHAVNKILEDIVHACNPRKIKVTGIFKVRGGITTKVEREHTRDEN